MLSDFFRLWKQEHRAVGYCDPVRGLFTSLGVLWRKSCRVLVTTLCPIWVTSMFMKLQFKPKSQELSQVSQCMLDLSGGAAVCWLQFSDLPPCRWLPLFAHSVNYYQKAVYLGCSPTLLHILWPIIKGDLHYKPWSPSKKATVSASGPIPAALQHYLSTPSCFVSPSLSLHLLLPFSLSPNPLAWTCTCWLNCPWQQVPHPLTLLFIIPFMFAVSFFGVVIGQKHWKSKNTRASPQPMELLFLGFKWSVYVLCY